MGESFSNFSTGNNRYRSLLSIYGCDYKLWFILQVEIWKYKSKNSPKSKHFRIGIIPKNGKFHIWPHMTNHSQNKCLLKILYKLGTLVHTYNSSTQEVESRGPWIQGQPWLHTKALSKKWGESLKNGWIGKGACCQSWWLEFDPQDPYGTTPKSCPLNCTCPQCLCTYIHIQINRRKRKKGEIKEEG